MLKFIKKKKRTTNDQNCRAMFKNYVPLNSREGNNE